MKFKINVFRDIMIYLEDNLSYDKRIINSTEIKVKNYSPDEIAYHIEMIVDYEFIKYTEMSVPSDRYRLFFIRRLTASGHEFLESVKNDTVWKKMQEGASFVGVEIIKSSIPILLAYAKTQLGIP